MHMSKRLRDTLLFCIFVGLFGAPSLTLGASKDGQPAAGSEALDWAFRFASAIESDPVDQAQAQELVVREYAARGMLDEALARAEQIDGWRQGTAYADLARIFAVEGRSEEARSLVERAEAVRTGVEGWENPRISMHVAQALAVLGELDRTREITAPLATSDRAYTGRSMAVFAMAQARRGSFDEALESLGALDGDRDVYVTWWRAEGYLDIAGQEQLSRQQRLQALELAGEAAKQIAGWKQAQTLGRVADEYIELGMKKKARPLLERADEWGLPMEEAIAMRGALLGQTAVYWARLGEKKHARELLAQAELSVPHALNIDQSAIYAYVATGYIELGDDDAAWRLYGRAFDVAESVKNSRPRALALAAVCRTMGRDGVALTDAGRERLQALYDGLGDPW
jgi:tetratricopeptide (TPR) repeat protein